MGDRIRVVRILALGERRGPAPEAQGMYDDLSPPETSPANAPGFDGNRHGGGRPSKKDRRALDRINRDGAG